MAGQPYTLQVNEDTALCSLAHAEGLVLLCSSYACGPGLELELDQDWRALDIQCRGRFEPKHRVQPPPAIRMRPTAPSRNGMPHYQMPELREHLEDALLKPSAEGATSADTS
eukprot:3780409-Prymnesium_polylepis.1